mgnify:CR=1 FL=1
MNANTNDLATLQHAANLIQNNADDLRLAFKCDDGEYYSCDSDIEAEINDMDRTAALLYSISENFSKS